jgi:hypothetical protein
VMEQGKMAFGIKEYPGLPKPNSTLYLVLISEIKNLVFRSRMVLLVSSGKGLQQYSKSFDIKQPVPTESFSIHHSFFVKTSLTHCTYRTNLAHNQGCKSFRSSVERYITTHGKVVLPWSRRACLCEKLKAG